MGEYGPLRNAELDLTIGSVVKYRKFRWRYWVEAQVIDFRQSAFGREVRLKYFGFSTHSECRRQGVTDWIPVESAEIGAYHRFGAPHRSRINEACGKYMDNFEGHQGDMAWIRKFKEYEFASVYQKVKRTLRKMEIDAMKTVDTAGERVQSRHKKKWKKGKRGNYQKWNERKMRESQQKERDQKRKCGRISKYAACY